MHPPRIKLSAIKRSLPEPILPVLNKPTEASVAVESKTPWRGVPVPSKRGSTSPFDPPAAFVPPEPYQPPVSGATAEPFAPAVDAGVPDSAGDEVAPAPTSAEVEAPVVAEAEDAPVVTEATAAAPAATGSFAAAALSISRASGVGTLVPAGMTPAAANASAAAASTSDSASGVDGSGALLVESSQPVQIRATAVFLKWTIFALIGLAVAFALIRFVLPFLNEVRHPGRRDAIANKDAPTAVRMIQQTREVVAKSDANAAYLNEIAAAAENKPVETKPTAAPAAPVPVVTAPLPAVAPAADLNRFNQVVEAFKVASVVSGPAARAMIDGRLVRLGDIVDRPLGLRFAGVDVETHTVLFTNADNVVFKKYY